MEVRFKAPKQAASTALERDVRQRLASALAHCQDEVQRVDVRLGQAEHSDALHDGYCVIQVRLSAGRSATVIEIARDATIAARHAVRRAGRLADEQRAARVNGTTPAAALR